MPDRGPRSEPNPLWVFAGFVGLSGVLSWALWLPVMLSQRGVIGVELRPHPFGSFGPAFATVVVCAARDGRSGVTGSLRHLGRVRVGASWYVVAALPPPLTFALALGLHAAVAGLPAGGSP